MDQDRGSTTGIKKFDGTHFLVLRELVECVLVAKGLDYVLKDPSLPLGSGTDSQSAKWQKDDKTARALILLSLDSEIVKMVLSCPTSRSVWDRLKIVRAEI